LEQARTYTLEAIVSARRTDSLVIEAAGLMNLARIDKFLCRWASAVDSLNQALTLSNDSGQRFYALIVRQLLTIVTWKGGDRMTGDKVAWECRDGGGRRGQSPHENYARQILALIELHRGEYASSRFYLEDVATQVDPESRRSLLASEFIGDTYLEEGD